MANLTSLAAVQNQMRIGTGNTDLNTLITQLLPGVDAAIQAWCGRLLFQQTCTEFVTARNTPFLRLRDTPVVQATLLCNLTAGSAVVTGITSPLGAAVPTAPLAAGMPAVSPLGFVAPLASLPQGATVVSVDSSTQVTLSAPALLTLAQTPISFGVAVYLDPGGYYGAGYGSSGLPAPFAAGTQLVPGSDYHMKVDQADGVTSKGGLLQRLNTYWPGARERDGGLLTDARGPGRGNVLVLYAGGFPASAIPADLALAATLTCAYLASMVKGTGRLTAEGLGAYHYALATPQDTTVAIRASGAAPYLAAFTRVR